MRPTSDARDASDDTEDRDPYNAEPVRSDPWASGPGHLTQDEPTEPHVPDQRDGDHDGHLYASDTYAEPETEVLAPSSADGHRPDAQHDNDEPTSVGGAHVDSHADTRTDTADDEAATKADDAAAKADDTVVEAEETRAASGDEPDPRPDAEARPEPEIETVALPPAEPVAVVEPVGDRPGDIIAVPVAAPVVERADDERAPADEPSGELKPGDVPVAPVAGFLSADAARGLRDRWREAQLGFVDDPRRAVDDVRALVGEAVDQFTSALSAQRDELDAAAGEDTEQYRIAVRRYRAFFDRLLDL